MLDTSALLGSIFSGAWPFLLLIIIVLFFRTPFMKGKIGEGLVNIANSVVLDETVYIPVKNITLMLADGSTTQIDHVLVSKYGIFVIETKNMKGWIYGDECEKYWTQQIFKQKHQFQNPLHQNRRHIKALGEVLGLPLSVFVSIVVFVGECKFKTAKPSDVFLGMSYIRFIRSFTKEEFSDVQIEQIVNSLQSQCLKQSFQTDHVHVKNLKERLNQPSNAKVCPKCGGTILLRNNRANGNAFYGCSNYPRCRHTEQAK